VIHPLCKYIIIMTPWALDENNVNERPCSMQKRKRSVYNIILFHYYDYDDDSTGDD